MRRVGNYPLWVGNARDAWDIQGVPVEVLKTMPGPADVSPTLLRELQRTVEELA